MKIVAGLGQAPRHKEGENEDRHGREYGLAGKERNSHSCGGATHPIYTIMTYDTPAGVPVLRPG